MNSWINLRGARNNLYIITYVINLKKKSQNQGGGGSTLPYLSIVKSGGLRPPNPPPPHFGAPGSAVVNVMDCTRQRQSHMRYALNTIQFISDESSAGLLLYLCE